MLNIVFMGTPDLAKRSLQKLHEAGNHILAVVTTPDKQKGRGMKYSMSPVKEYALEQNFTIYQPEKIRKNEEFLEKIARDEFLEYEEVYPGCFYGTLKSEVERIWAKGHTVLFDIDVVGGVHVKQILGEQALAIFIQPPSVEVLRQRLIGRATDDPDKIEQRLAKAEYEMTFAGQFDTVIVNDRLEDALQEAETKVREFLGV